MSGNLDKSPPAGLGLVLLSAIYAGYFFGFYEALTFFELDIPFDLKTFETSFGALGGIIFTVSILVILFVYFGAVWVLSVTTLCIFFILLGYREEETGSIGDAFKDSFSQYFPRQLVDSKLREQKRLEKLIYQLEKSLPEEILRLATKEDDDFSQRLKLTEMKIKDLKSQLAELKKDTGV